MIHVFGQDAISSISLAMVTTDNLQNYLKLIIECGLMPTQVELDLCQNYIDVASSHIRDAYENIHVFGAPPVIRGGLVRVHSKLLKLVRVKHVLRTAARSSLILQQLEIAVGDYTRRFIRLT